MQIKLFNETSQNEAASPSNGKSRKELTSPYIGSDCGTTEKLGNDDDPAIDSVILSKKDPTNQIAAPDEKHFSTSNQVRATQSKEENTVRSSQSSPDKHPTDTYSRLQNPTVVAQTSANYDTIMRENQIFKIETSKNDGTQQTSGNPADQNADSKCNEHKVHSESAELDNGLTVDENTSASLYENFRNELEAIKSNENQHE